MFSRYHLYLIAALLLLPGNSVVGHPADENPDLTLPETTRRFRQDKFGLSINWGVYSVLGDGESVMKDRKISNADYERIASSFNPTEFNAVKWVGLAKSAGVRYITFSCKGPDGFAMWNSKASDWNVVGRTPFARDVVKELADECHKQGIKFFVGFSQMDWHESEAETGEDNLANDKAQDNASSASAKLAAAQLSELLRNYGKIDGVRLDGWANSPDSKRTLHSLYHQIHDLQPAALIASDHPGEPDHDESYKIQNHAEQALAESNYLGPFKYGRIPLEVSETINNSHGYRRTDKDFKSTRKLIQELIRTAGMDANLSLNIGAMPNGEFQPELTDRLHEIGMWLAKNGESIYETRGGPYPPQPWGVMTHRGKRVYVHVLDPETTSIAIRLPSKLQAARYFPDDSDVKYQDNDGTITLSLRKERKDDVERLIVLRTLTDN